MLTLRAFQALGQTSLISDETCTSLSCYPLRFDHLIYSVVNTVWASYWFYSFLLLLLMHLQPPPHCWPTVMDSSRLTTLQVSQQNYAHITRKVWPYCLISLFKFIFDFWNKKYSKSYHCVQQLSVCLLSHQNNILSYGLGVPLYYNMFTMWFAVQDVLATPSYASP